MKVYFGEKSAHERLLNQSFLSLTGALGLVILDLCPCVYFMQYSFKKNFQTVTPASQKLPENFQGQLQG